MPKAPLIVLAAVVIVVAVLVGGWFAATGNLLKQAPSQPIAFPHDRHVAVAELQCAFCHRNAASTVEAGLPSVEQCMFCHTVVGGDSPEIAKLRTAYVEQKPIDWKRVYRLPDVVRFTHEPHIRAQVDCASCHGNVSEMTVARAGGPLGMAQCVSCHRQRGAPADCSYCHY